VTSNPNAVIAPPPARERCRNVRREIAICSSETRRPRASINIPQSVSSKPEKVQFNLLVPALARPEIERRPRDLVDDGDGTAEPGEIDGFKIVLARVARVDAQVIVRGRVEISELPLVLFAASRAQQATEWPRGQARGTEQFAAAAIGVRRVMENRHLRRAAAEGAHVVGARQIAIDRV